MASLEELKRLASKRVKLGQDVGVDEAQRFMNAHLLKQGSTPILFAYLYYLYVKWRKKSDRTYVSRRHFGKLLKNYLRPGKTRIGKTNYVTYKLSGIDKPKRLDEAWKLLWYEQKSHTQKKKKERRS